MSTYHWLLTVKLSGGDLAIAAMSNHAPDPGDLVELEGGALATVVTKSIFTDYDDEYRAATAIVKPLKVVRWYEQKPVEEDAQNAPC